MPVARVGERLVNTNGAHTVEVHFHRCQVGGTGYIFIQNMVLDETVQGIHAVGQVLEAVARCTDILGVNLVIDLAGLVVEGTDISFGNAVFLFQYIIGLDKEGIADFFVSGTQ